MIFSFICCLNRLPEMRDWHSPNSELSHMRLKKLLSYCHCVWMSKERRVTQQGEPTRQGRLRTINTPVQLASNPSSSKNGIPLWHRNFCRRTAKHCMLTMHRDKAQLLHSLPEKECTSLNVCVHTLHVLKAKGWNQNEPLLPTCQVTHIQPVILWSNFFFRLPPTGPKSYIFPAYCHNCFIPHCKRTHQDKLPNRPQSAQYVRSPSNKEARLKQDPTLTGIWLEKSRSFFSPL